MKKICLSAAVAGILLFSYLSISTTVQAGQPTIPQHILDQLNVAIKVSDAVEVQNIIHQNPELRKEIAYLIVHEDRSMAEAILRSELQKNGESPIAGALKNDLLSTAPANAGTVTNTANLPTGSGSGAGSTSGVLGRDAFGNALHNPMTVLSNPASTEDPTDR